MVNRHLVHTLSREENLLAQRVGKARHVARGPGTTRSLIVDVQRARAECAAGAVLNRPWDGEFTGWERWKVWSKTELDPSDFVIRTTKYATDGLILQEYDDDRAVFLLVVDRDAPKYDIVGWCTGSEGKKSEYFSSEASLGPPAYEVPRDTLRSAWDLRRAPEGATSGGARRDPAPDFAGTGKYPKRRYADDGRHPADVGNIITSKYALPCCRCQHLIPAGHKITGSPTTGTIHGDPLECRSR